MTSKICISDIEYLTIKHPADLPESRLKDGRLPAGTVVNRMSPGQTIDVIILKKSPSLLCDTSIEINETDIRKRITYKLNRMSPGQTIDVIFPDILKKSPSLLCDTSIEINETDIRKRITYKYSDISDNCFNNQRLAVGVKFFKGMQPTDTIYLILH